MSLATMYYSCARDAENKFVRLRRTKKLACLTSVAPRRFALPIFIATGGYADPRYVLQTCLFLLEFPRYLRCELHLADQTFAFPANPRRISTKIYICRDIVILCCFQIGILLRRCKRLIHLNLSLFHQIFRYLDRINWDIGTANWKRWPIDVMF